MDALNKFGPVGPILHVALPLFSTDVVGVVASYAACVSAKPGAEAKLLMTLGSRGDGPGEFQGDVEGIAVSPDSNIWVTNSLGQRVHVFSSEGKFLFAVAPGQWKDPRCIAFDRNTPGAHAFIADFGAGCIVVCRLDGTVSRTFGSLSRPHGIAIDSKRSLVALSEMSGNVKLFNLDGSLVRRVAKDAKSEGHGLVKYPRGVCFTLGGELLVLEASRVNVFDVSGAFLRHFGEGKLNNAYGLCIDNAGNILVADDQAKCVWCFDISGVLFTSINTRLEPEGGHCDVNYTRVVFVDKDNRIYIGGSEPRAQVVGFCA